MRRVTGPQRPPRVSSNLGQQADVRLRVAPGKRPPRTPASVFDAPGLPVLGDQTRDLSSAEPRRLRQEAPHQTLVRPRQPEAPRTHQKPPHEAIRVGAVHEPEVDRRAAGHEVPDLVQGPKPFDVELQDRPPMITNHRSGSSLVGLTSTLQAHLTWDKTATRVARPTVLSLPAPTTGGPPQPEVLHNRRSSTTGGPPQPEVLHNRRSSTTGGPPQPEVLHEERTLVP